MQYKLNQCQKFYNSNKDIRIENIDVYEDSDKSIEINTLPNYKSFRESQIFFGFCIFKNTFNIENGMYFSDGVKRQRIEVLFFKNCVFENNIRLFNELIEYELIFENCIFLGEVNLEKSVFENYFGFSNSIFFNDINLKDTTFDSRVSFRNITLNTKNEFNLEETYINDKAEFIRICSKDLVQREYLDYNSFYKSIEEIKEEKYLNVKNRETARIIKDSFEQQNNIIEANKFYALEMKEREKELERDKKEDKNIFEWLVFKIHGLTSNHSQDWTLALYWILIIGATFSFINNCTGFWSSFITVIFSMIIFFCNNFNKWIKLLLFYGLYILKTGDILLHGVVKVINPFEKSSGIGLIEFLSKIIIAYLIYQLIVSIRQNTRRK